MKVLRRVISRSRGFLKAGSKGAHSVFGGVSKRIPRFQDDPHPQDGTAPLRSASNAPAST